MPARYGMGIVRPNTQDHCSVDTEVPDSSNLGESKRGLSGSLAGDCRALDPKTRDRRSRAQGKRIGTHLSLLVNVCFAASALASGQSNYRVVAVSNGGTISGTVKWSGPAASLAEFPVTKDPAICDPESKKTVDLGRLIIGPQAGVANTIVYLKDISSGKAMDLPEQRRHLDQLHCRYIPHILLVPQNATLQMESSDATLHTIHMEGAASFNLPFPFTHQITARAMSTPGLVTLRCNGGHVWMSAEMMVVQHPYYAVTDESGKFEFTDVPAGTYQIVAWHEGWVHSGKQQVYDVLSQHKIYRPVFTEPKTWEKSVTVTPSNVSVVNFAISGK